MFNLGGSEVIVILLVALIVLGPEKLPETARKIGNVMGELRRMSTGFQQELRAAVDDTIKDRPPADAPAADGAATSAAPIEEPAADAPKLEAVPDEAPEVRADVRPDDPAA
jgi:sec-independent protein translocase protein TatB